MTTSTIPDPLGRSDRPGRFDAHRQATPGEPLRLPLGARIAWLVVGSLLATAALGFGTLQVVSLLAHERHTELATVPAQGIGLLHVDSDHGRIEVVGADVTSIRLDARVSDGLFDAGYHHDVVGDRLEVRVRCQDFANVWCGVDLRIVVPRDLAVRLSSEGGAVEVRGLTGRVEATSDNGSVTGEELAGPTLLRSGNGRVRGVALRTPTLEASSSNGSVRVELARAPRAVVARSDNGSVEVALPRGETTYAVQVDSDNGSETNAVRSDPLSDRTIIATSDNGSVTVRYAG